MTTLTISAVTVSQSTGTLTWDNAAGPANNDTVTIGSKTYTFKTALTPTEGEVLLNGGGDAALLNLIRAINHSGTPGTDYKCAAANTQVTAATSVTSHAFAVTAIVPGISGDAIATTDTAANLSWGAATLTGGTSVSITGTLSDVTYSLPGQQMTVTEYPAGNSSWSRAHRMTDDALLMLRYGTDSVAIAIASLGKIGYSIKPALTWSLSIATQPTNQSCVHSSTAATFTVAVTANELTTTYQWQESTDGGSNWSNVTTGGIYAGATSASLVITPTTTGQDGYKYRCICKNNNGNVTTSTVTLTVT